MTTNKKQKQYLVKVAITSQNNQSIKGELWEYNNNPSITDKL
jgi:hypothetical protein